ncbi:MAG: translation initiation factor IF-6 [Candidatus Micrarchaeales archaeon]
MGAAKCMIKGSDYIGVFAAATEKYVFLGNGIERRARDIVTGALKVLPIELTMFATDMVGLFVKGNSNGLLLSNLMDEREIDVLKKYDLDMNVEIMESGLNAIGNNILVNDKIAIINPDYSHESRKQIADVLGVEVIEQEIGGFKTVGANDILTNNGLVINNRATDQQKEAIDKIVGFDSVRTTANTGSLNIGISTISNSRGVVVGGNTTGFELTRITDGLEIND